MRTGSGKFGKVGVGLFLLSGAVLAQPGSPPGPWMPPPGQGATSVPAPGARPTLSPDELLKAGTEYRKTMASVANDIEKLLNEARKQKDLIKVNCLSDKLIQARAILNVADKSFKDMQEAIRRNNEGLAFDQYARIAILNQNVQVLTIEADNCIGADMAFIGAPKTDTITEGVPVGDPTNPGEEEEEVPPVTRPPRASPFL